MSNDIYKILENFDRVEEGPVSSEGWSATEVFGTNRDGGEESFEIEYRAIDGTIVEVVWPDESDFYPEREVYFDQEDIMDQLRDHVSSGEMTETTTQISKMGDKVRVTKDGDTTEFDDEETAAAMMGGMDDDDQFTTESESDYSNPDAIAQDMARRYKENENNVQDVMRNSAEPYRATMDALLPDSERLEGIKPELWWEILRRFEGHINDRPPVEDWNESKEPVTADMNEAKISSNVSDVRDDLRAAGVKVRYTDKMKSGAYSLKIPGPRVFAQRGEDNSEIKKALKRAQQISKKVQGIVNDRGEVKINKFYAPQGPGYEFNIRVIIQPAKESATEGRNKDKKVNEDFGNYDDFEGTPMMDPSGPEYSTFDADNPDHRKRLQNGTPVVLSPEIMTDPAGDRTGVFVKRSQSGHFGTVVRNCDGKQVNVHLDDIVSADITNNSIYEEYGINFDLMLNEDAVTEDITITQTTNPEHPENDTTTVTGVGSEAADELAAMMANAGMNSGEYKGMDSPPHDEMPVDHGEPEMAPDENHGMVMLPPDDMNEMDDDEYVPQPDNWEEDTSCRNEAGERIHDRVEQHKTEKHDTNEAGFDDMEPSDDDLMSIDLDFSDDDDDLDVLGQFKDDPEYDDMSDMEDGDPEELRFDDVDHTAEEPLMADRDIEHSNSPRELIAKLDAILQGGGLNKKKKMYSPAAAGGDNPMAVNEAKENCGEEDCTHCNGPDAGSYDCTKDDKDEVNEEWEKPWEKDDDKEEDDKDAKDDDKDNVEEDKDDDKLVNEHEDVDGFLNLYKKITEL